jgi:hypothetical protein
MMADELSIDMEMIRRILHEDLLKRKICAKFVPHRLTEEQKQRRLTSCQGFVQTCQDNASFLYCIFIFPKVKTALKGKRFQDVEDIKKNVTAELKAVLFWRPLLTVFKNILNDSKHLLKLAEITLNRKTKQFFIYFFITITLLPGIYIQLESENRIQFPDTRAQNWRCCNAVCIPHS